MSVKAEALFKRHIIGGYQELLNHAKDIVPENTPNELQAQILLNLTILYSACVISESIRNEMDEVGERKEL